MKAIRLSFFQMAVAMRRDMMLSVSCFAPVLAGIFFRFAIPSIEAALTDSLHIFKLTPLSSITILLLAAGGTLQGMIVALLVLTFSSNKLEGMAVTKLSTLTVFGAVIPFFIKSDIQYVISPLPSFWIGKAILENIPLYMLPAFILYAMWICFLFKRYLRKIR